MSVLVVAGLLLAQLSPITVEGARSDAEVGYRELVSNRPADAIAKIDANRSIGADDPAALLNRGTAQARLGRIDAARDSYRAALSSRDRYEVELEDGSWMDSRAAARLAIALLGQGRTLALK